MSDTAKAAIISAFISAIAGIIVGMMTSYAMMNGGTKEITVVIDGVKKTINEKDNQEIIDEFEKKNIELENKIDKLASQKGGSDSALAYSSNTPKPTAAGKKGETVELRSITPMIGKDEDFWDDSYGDKDNLGNDEYSLEVQCYGSDDGITYPLDKKYSILKGKIALSASSNDSSGIWLEFFSGDKKLGETEHMKAGSRPSEFQIDVSNVTDLRVSTNCTNEEGYLLMNEFELILK